MGFLLVANKRTVSFRNNGKCLLVGETVRFYLVFQDSHDTERNHAQN
jgi:hypothetical protein